MKVVTLASGRNHLTDAQGFILEEQVDTTSTGVLATIPQITAPIIRLTNNSLVSFNKITAPGPVNEVTVFNNTSNQVTVVFQASGVDGILMGDKSNAILPANGAFTAIYSNSKWVVSGIIGSYATLTTNNQIFTGLQQEFTNKVWFNDGIKFVDQLSTFTSVDFNQSPAQSMDTPYILPPDLGSNGQVLTTDGLGVLTWTNKGSGGGGSTVHTQTVDIDFGASGDYVTTTVSAAWVTPSHNIVFSVTPNTLDHDVEDCILEEITCSYGNIVNGVSFDLHVHAPNETWGRYKIKVIGV